MAILTNLILLPVPRATPRGQFQPVDDNCRPIKAVAPARPAADPLLPL